jgi:TolB protein
MRRLQAIRIPLTAGQVWTSALALAVAIPVLVWGGRAPVFVQPTPPVQAISTPSAPAPPPPIAVAPGPAYAPPPAAPGGPAPAEGPAPALNTSSARDRIVFSRLGADGYRLYSMNVDGSDLTQLTEGPGDDIQADVSRDGRIAFAHGWATYPRGPATRIYIRERNGEVHPLLEEFPGFPPMSDYSPRWSPDGRRIAFTRADVGGELSPVSQVNAAIYVVNADGTGLRAVAPPGDRHFPTWSPDGRRIAYTGPAPEVRPVLWVVDVDNPRSKPRRLTKGNAYQPRWSPDGRWIAFTSTRDGASWQVYVVRSDGRIERRLTNTGDHQDKFPAWSPDGRTMVFESTRDDACPSPVSAGCRLSRIYMMRSDGKRQKAITDGPADSYPVWWPSR